MITFQGDFVDSIVIDVFRARDQHTSFCYLRTRPQECIKFSPEVRPAMEQIFGKKLLAENLELATYYADKVVGTPSRDCYRIRSYQKQKLMCCNCRVECVADLTEARSVGMDRRRSLYEHWPRRAPNARSAVGAGPCAERYRDDGSLTRSSLLPRGSKHCMAVKH